MDSEQVIKVIDTEIKIAKMVNKDYTTVDLDVLEPAIAMLKEQEPAAPGILQDIEGIWSTCPRCKSKLWLFFGMTMEINPDHMPKYCQQCGKPIKWEGKTI